VPNHRKSREESPPKEAHALKSLTTFCKKRGKVFREHAFYKQNHCNENDYFKSLNPDKKQKR